MASIVTVTLRIDMSNSEDREIVYASANGRSFRWRGDWFEVTSVRQTRKGILLTARPDPSYVVPASNVPA